MIRDKIEIDEKHILEYVRAKFPKHWRAMIREAWMTGDYSPLGLSENQDQTLQLIRNTRGLTWLMRIKI